MIINVNDITAAYLGAMLDFEGSFEITYTPLPSVRIALAQKSYQLLEIVKSIYGGNFYRMQLVIFKAEEVEHFLSDIHTFVIMRKEETLLALALIRAVLQSGGQGKRVSQELKDRRFTLAEQLRKAYLQHKASKTLEAA